MATAELVLETAVDALTRRTFVIANVLGKLKADPLQAPSLGLQLLRPSLVAARLLSINGTWLRERLCARIGSAS